MELPYWKGYLRSLHSSWISYRNASEICRYLLKFFYYLQKWSEVVNVDLHAGLQEHTHIQILLDEQQTPLKERTRALLCLHW